MLFRSKTTLILYPAKKTGTYTIPNSVTYIGNSAFYNCTGLTSVIIPNSVTDIGIDAFRDCSNLTEIVNYQETPQYVIESSMSGTTFGGVNKVNCTLLVPAGSVRAYRAANVWKYFSKMGVIGDPGSVGIGGIEGTLTWTLSDDGNTLIFSGDGVVIGNRISYGTGHSPGGTTYTTWYAYSESVTRLVLNEGISEIRENAYMWPNLTDIEVSADNPYLSSVDGVLFDKGKTTLINYPEGKKDKSYTIPNSVTEIGNSVFLNCTELTSVTIPNSVTDIGNNVFSGCTGLTSVTIPSGVTKIGDQAFSGCTGLSSIIIPNGVVSSGWSMFGECTGLTSVIVPNSIIETGNYTFYGCTGLTSVTIPDGVTTIGSVFSGTGITSVTIPNSIAKIGDHSFYRCTGLTSVIIPNSVTEIGIEAFGGCISLSSIDIPNSVISIGGKAFHGCANLTTVVIPNSITILSEMLFWECTSLTSIIIPNSVTEIGQAAFDGCSSLKSVTIPDKVTSISNNSFSSCKSLTSITIPNSVTNIGLFAFYNCTGLTEVINKREVPQPLYKNYDGGLFPFGGVNKKSCTLFVPAGSETAYRAADGWKDFVNIKAIQ